MSITMNYDYAQSIVMSKGWDSFLEVLQGLCKGFDLYGCSQAWFESDEYICKAKGVYGDLIVRWEHRC